MKFHLADSSAHPDDEEIRFLLLPEIYSTF